MSFRHRTFTYILSILLCLIGMSFFVSLLDLNFQMKVFEDIHSFDLLMSQIGNTLIVLSLTSVLSTNFGQVYWVDIRETKLIEPFWGCFIGITIYLLTGLIFSGISYMMSFPIGVIVSFISMTLLLIILTFKMISIYFGKDKLKKQLHIEYKKIILLTKYPYVHDYVRKLIIFKDDCKEKEFSNKRLFLRKINKEIKKIQEELSSSDEDQVDKAHKDHINKYAQALDELKRLDGKIAEYTRNAISINNYEVIRENIELLVECQNYHSFFDLIEEVFEWDQKYACFELKKINEENVHWLIQDQMKFFKQYALEKLIVDSGKIDAIESLLRIYDPKNLAMKELEEKIKPIQKKIHELRIQEAEILKKISQAEDCIEEMKNQEKTKGELKKQSDNLKKEWLEVLASAGPQEIRSYYIPIKEAYLAYIKGQYEIANKYLSVIILNYQLDIESIKSFLGINEINFDFSYVTNEEYGLIKKIVEKDKNSHFINNDCREKLLAMNNVSIDNTSFCVM